MHSCFNDLIAPLSQIKKKKKMSGIYDWKGKKEAKNQGKTFILPPRKPLSDLAVGKT